MLKNIRNNFLTGLLLLTPLFITIYLVIWIFKLLDNMLGKYIAQFLGFNIPGTGIIISAIIITLIGALLRNVVGKKLLEYAEKVLMRIPLVKSVYSTLKQAATVVSKKDNNFMKKVVLIEYPRKGVYSIGFLTSEFRSEIDDKSGIDNLKAVFVASTPNPTTGWLIFLSENEIIELNMSVEDGMKLVISGGIVAPDREVNKKIEVDIKSASI